MPKKLPLNTPGGLIEDPEAYLHACTGRAYHRLDGYCSDIDFRLRQNEYEQRDGRPCPNCTPAALINALGAYRTVFPQIPADPQECYRLLRAHLRLIELPVPGCSGYPSFLNAALVRRLWRLLGIDAWPAVYPLPSARILRREADRGIPLVLSIWSRAYRAHTVLLLGWEVWTDERLPRLFWIVRDGWRHEPRWIDADDVLIWQAIRLAR